MALVYRNRFLEEKFGIVVPRPPRVSFDRPQEPEQPGTDPSHGEENLHPTSASNAEKSSDSTMTYSGDSGSEYSDSDEWYTDTDLDINVKRVYDRAARETREQSYAASESELSGKRSDKERNNIWSRLAARRAERNLERRRRRLSLRTTPMKRHRLARRNTNSDRDRSYIYGHSDDDYSPARNHFFSPLSAPAPPTITLFALSQGPAAFHLHPATLPQLYPMNLKSGAYRHISQLPDGLQHGDRMLLRC